MTRWPRIERRGLSTRSPRCGLLVLAGLALLGCAGSVPPEGLGPEADFLRGERQFEEGRYLQAVQTLDNFRTEHPGSDRVDDAIFLLGKAHQKLGEQILAREEFDRVLRDFPQSEHREEAQFETAISWLEEAHGPALDPEPTQAALEAFQAYLRRYPDGAHREEADRYVLVCLDRLAVKAFLNAKTYLALKQTAAARIYFEKALRIYSDFSRAGEALYGLAQTYEREGDHAGARAAYLQLLDYATPERTAKDKQLRALRQRAQEVLKSEGNPDGRSS